jgi:hypothetical protein
MRTLLVALLTTMAVAAEIQAQAPNADELNDKTFAKWRDRIRPTNDDVCYKTVDWLPTFWDAVIVAQNEEKPILLWAMNGHPLACT